MAHETSNETNVGEQAYFAETRYANFIDAYSYAEQQLEELLEQEPSKIKLFFKRSSMVHAINKFYDRYEEIEKEKNLLNDSLKEDINNKYETITKILKTNEYEVSKFLSKDLSHESQARIAQYTNKIKD